MALNPKQNQAPISVEQYFLLMQNGNRRCEYYAGQIRDMSGGTSDHATISGNMYMALRLALGDSEACMPYVADKMTRLDDRHIVLPDVVVTCDETDHGQALIIEAPCVAVEVLSKTTQMYDRTRKLALYQAKESIQEIIFVSQEVQWVEVFTRTPQGWLYHQYGASQHFHLESLDIEIEVRQLYRGLSIPLGVEEDEKSIVERLIT